MPNQYLIVPSPPTPNGRLHLGHMAGVYLPLDILTRTLRQHGKTVFFIGSTDAYDSYVSLLHDEEQERKRRVLDLHASITHDLKLLAIDMDDFSCPVDKVWHELYVQTQTNVFNTLATLGKIQAISEAYLEDIETGSICSGRRISGNCPHCFSSLRGFICEECGAINSPEHLINPSAVSGRPTLERQHISKFLKLSYDTLNYLRKRIAEQFASSEITNTPLWFLTQQDTLVRLTYAGEYGLSLKGFSANEKVFNYSGFADYIFAGELYKKLTGDKVNPFERASDFVTVGMCGFDNVLSSLVFESAVALESQIWKCVDYPIVSKLLTFEGSKFSTSRKHGIWAYELLSCNKVDRDILRYYLADLCTKETTCDFSVARYIEFSNTGAGRYFYNSIQRTHDFLTTVELVTSVQIDCPPSLTQLFSACWFNTELNDLSVSAVIEGIENWMAQQAMLMENQEGALVYLYGLAILAYPVLPGVALVLWTSLGLTGLPTLTQSPPPLCYRGVFLSLPLLDKTDIAFSIHQMQDAE
ncbi:class I tRNA ligase family protein [Pseudomonas sp. FP597]|uniref:class I tRNA ligase family protein n=1 Tax=Pseudomonas sp. FP597 TaxID=2954096 RepID=UPI002736F30F|nr:class I tRNA ligase family protein [Pseudomonas sp. FP597]WLI07436.1 class I tRNA ligase family protein [Pseudomonas sp. FP597]